MPPLPSSLRGSDARTPGFLRQSHGHSRRHSANAPVRPSAALVLSLPLLALAACARSDASTVDTTARAIPVELARVESRSLTPPVLATGTVAGKEEVALSFTIGGVVSRILVDEGTQVRAGQLLAKLSPVEITSQVAKAEQARAKAERDLARVRTLHADSIATTEQLQDATTAFEVAAQDVHIARFNLDHAVVRAPTSGVVLRRLAEPSQVVAPGTPVLVVRSSQRGVVLRAALPDRDAVRVRLGDDATVRFDALPGEQFPARVTQRAAAASLGSGTYDVELSLDQGAASLASGLIGQAEIRTRRGASEPAVPLEALVEADGDSAFVFVVAPYATKATRRQVHIGRILGAMVSISRGLVEGELVVVRGAAYIDDTSPLDIRRAPVATPSREGR